MTKILKVFKIERVRYEKLKNQQSDKINECMY